MTLGDDDLRRALADDGPAGRDGCPAAEELADLAAGALEDGRRLALVDHLAGCAECAAEVRALAGLEEWAANAAVRLAPARPEPVAARPPRRRRGRALALAAAALVVCVFVPLALRTGRPAPPDAPVFRSEPAAAIRSLVPEDVPQPRASLLLRWTPVAGALGYSVTLSTVDLTRVDGARGLGKPEYAPAAAALAALPPHTRLLWIVEAQLPDGLRLTTPAFAVVIE